MITSWNLCTIQDLQDKGEAQLKTGPFGTQLHASDYVETGTPVINVRNIGFGEIREEKLEFIAEQTVQRLSSHLLEAGDIVFGRKGAVERHAFINPKYARWFQGSDCLRLRVKSASIDSRFLSYYFLTEHHKQWMINQCSHGATMASLNQAIISRIPLLLPPIHTQRKIVSILSAYDRLIENNTRRIEILEEMARSIYREWFVKFRFPGHEQVQMVDSELGLIPEGWEVKNLGNLTSVITKGTTPTTLGQKYTSEGINFIKVESIDSSGSILDNKLAKIDKETHILLKRSQLKTGDILFSIAGAIGRSTIISENVLPANTNQALAIIRPIEPLLVLYLYRVIQSREFVNFSLGRVVQTAQANVSLSVLSAAPIIVPDKLTLEKFRDISQPIVKAVDLVQQKNLNLRKTRDLLLPRLISGEIDVENLDINTGPIAA